MASAVVEGPRAYVEERFASAATAMLLRAFASWFATQDRRREKQLESVLLEGLRSADAKPLGQADFARARANVRELAVRKQAKSQD